MDQSVFHIILTSCATAAIGLVGWIVRGVLSRVAMIEQTLTQHVIKDASDISSLNAKVDIILHALDKE